MSKMFRLFFVFVLLSSPVAFVGCGPSLDPAAETQQDDDSDDGKGGIDPDSEPQEAADDE